MGYLKKIKKEKPMGQTGSHGHSFVILGYSDKGQNKGINDKHWTKVRIKADDRIYVIT